MCQFSPLEVSFRLAAGGWPHIMLALGGHSFLAACVMQNAER